MVDIQSPTAEIRREIKKKDDRKKPQGKNIMSASVTKGGHKKRSNNKISFVVLLFHRLEFNARHIPVCLSATQTPLAAET